MSVSTLESGSEMTMLDPLGMVPAVNSYVCLTVPDRRTTATEIQCWGSFTFWCGSWSGFEPYLWLTDPYPTPDPTLSSVTLRIQKSVKILFCKHCFSPLNTFMRKGKDPEQMDPYLDSGGPKTCGSGSPTLQKSNLILLCCSRRI